MTSPASGEESPIKTPEYFFEDDNDDDDDSTPFLWEWRFPKNSNWLVTRRKTIFSLPIELRTRIYTYALASHSPRPHFSGSSTWRIKPPALLQCSGSVRAEALPLYYAKFAVSAYDPMHANKWLRAIGKEARMALGRITVRWLDEENVLPKERMRLLLWANYRAVGVEVRKGAVKIFGHD